MMGGVLTRPTRSLHPLRDHAFEIAVMVAFTLVGVALTLDPNAAQHSPVGRDVAGWAHAWATMYLVGCPMTIYGLLHGSSRARVAGLTLVAGAMMMQGVGALTFRADDPRAYSYFAFAAACLLRAHAVVVFVTGDERATSVD